MEQLEARQQAGDFERMTKKEAAKLTEELTKLNRDPRRHPQDEAPAGRSSSSSTRIASGSPSPRPTSSRSRSSAPATRTSTPTSSTTSSRPTTTRSGPSGCSARSSPTRPSRAPRERAARLAVEPEPRLEPADVAAEDVDDAAVRRARRGPRRWRGPDLRARRRDDLLPGVRVAAAEVVAGAAGRGHRPTRSRPSSPARRPRRTSRTTRRSAGRLRRHRPPATRRRRRDRTTSIDAARGGRRRRTGEPGEAWRTISASAVKELRERTGAGFMDCKRALEETGGDIDKAVGAAARARPGRGGQEGRPRGPRGPRLRATSTPAAGSASSSRSTARPTSSPAPTQFQKLVRDLAVQVAGLAPPSTSTRSTIPADVLEAKQAELLADEAIQKKPEHIREQIVDGQLKKWYSQVCLLDQPFRDTERTGPRADHRRDRDDRREHPRPPLRPLRARGGAVSEAGPSTAAVQPGRDRAPLPADPPQAVR